MIKKLKKNKRFEFGQNWQDFIASLDPQRIKIAEKSILNMLKLKDLSKKKFLDIGSGSGLSSLAAKNLGANVFSFDYDMYSVKCTSKLKNQFYPNDAEWKVAKGSILNKKFLKSLGKFDIVYSWGVLHHTGKMWLAVDNTLNLVKKDGLCFIAIYNDQGIKSQIWWLVKYFYNYIPIYFKKIFVFLLSFFVFSILLIKYTLKLNPMKILNVIFNYKKKRGMNLFNDLIDWYGGFPYEFADYENLVDYIENKGFRLVKGKREFSLGCHEVVFIKI